MKISELISKLSREMHEHGDQDVYLRYSEDGQLFIESETNRVEFVYASLALGLDFKEKALTDRVTS